MVYDTSGALTANGFSLEGARFMGWSNTAAGGVGYNDKEVVLNISEDGNDMSLYAVWLYVIPNSCVYDATNHAPSVHGSGATMYFSFTELNDGNYTTGTATPDNRKDAGSYLYYYYAKDTKVAMAGSVTMVIEQKQLTSISWPVTQLTYSGSAQAPAAQAVGVCAGDVCNVTVTGQQLHTGTYTATASALSNANYRMPAVTTTQFTIVAKPVTITFTVADKTYDGSAAATITGYEIVGRCGTDDVQVSAGSASAVFDSPDAGLNKTVIGSGFAIAGVAVDTYHDYVLSAQPTSTGNITKQYVLIKSADAEKVYDGTALTANAYRIEEGGFARQGVEGFESVSITGTLTDAGSANNVFTYVLNSHTDPDNYQIAAVPGTLTVHPHAIENIKYTVYSGMYDGNAHAIISNYSATTVNDQPLTWLFSADGENWTDEMITVTTSDDSGTYYIRITAPNHTGEDRTIEVAIGIIIIDAPVISGADYTGSKYVPEVPESALYAVDSNPGGTDAGDYTVRLVLTNPVNYKWKTSDNEYVTIPYTISKVLASAVITANNLTYNESAQALVAETSVTGGTIGYSLTEGDYAADIPTRTNAGSYTVYWKITPDSNHLEATGFTPVIIKKGTPVLTATTDSLTYNASAQDLISVTSSTTQVTVLYSLGGGEFTTDVPSAVNAGTYSVQFKSLETENYNASVPGSATITIAKATFDRSYIHFTSASYQFDNTERSILVTTDAGHDLPAEIEPVYQNNTRTAVGTSNATVTFNVGSNYEPITGFSAKLEIYVLPLRYTATGYGGTYDGTAHPMVSVSVTTPATGAVITYSTTPSGTFVPDCPTVTDAGAGAVYFKISALGYVDVTDTRNYSVTKITISVSSATASRAYDGTAFTAPDLSLDGGTLATGHHLSGTATGSITNVGTTQNAFNVYVLDAGDNNVTANYEVKKNIGTLTVTKATFNASYIHFVDTMVPYDGQPHSLEIKMEPGHPLPAEITPVYTGNTGTDIGEYTATVNFTVSSNYNAISPMQAVMTIYDSDIIFTATVYSAVYDGESHPAIAIAVTTPDSTVTYSMDGETYVADCPTVSVAGQTQFWYMIEAYGHTTVNTRVTANVSLREITVTSATDSKSYDGTALTNHGITVDGTLAVGQNLSYAFLGSQTNAGVSDNAFTAKVIEGETDVSSNYDIESVFGKLTVRKAVFDSQYIHFDDTSYQYDGTQKTLHIWTDAGHDLPSEITAVYNGNTRIVVGTSNATVSFVVGNNYEAISPRTAKLTIYESQIVYTAAAYNGTYDGVAHDTVTVTVTTPGAVVTYSLNGQTYTEDCPTIINAGQRAVYYRIQLIGYTTVNQMVTAVVSKLNVSITSGTATKTFDGTPLTVPSLTVTGGSLAAGHTQIATATGTITNAGSTANVFTPIIQDGDGNNVTANYEVSKNTGTLTVNKANAQIVILPSEPFPYDITKNWYLDYTVTGLAPGDEIVANLRYVNSASQIVNPKAAGSYTVTVDNYQAVHGSLANYNVDKDSSVETLVILPRSIQAPAADPTEFVYDGSLKTYAIPASNYYTVQNNTQVQAGDYTVTLILTDSVNCAWSTGSSGNLEYQFSIAKRAIRVVADQMSKVYGEADPEFTYAVYGTAPGETAAFSGTAVAATHNIGANDISVGDLALMNNGAFRAANYTFTFEGAGSFTITPFMVDLPLAPGEFGTMIYTGEELTAYEDGLYYTVTGGKATEVGSYVATLTLTDNVNYVWSDTRNGDARDLQYRIVLAKINLVFTPYEGTYDGLYHDAAVIDDADGSTVYYGFDMMGWTTEVPQVKDVQKNGVLYIKAIRDKHEDFYAIVDYQIAKAVLDVYADGKLILMTDQLPEFTFRAEGFVNGETLDDLTCEIIFGTPYVPGQGWGTYAITCINGPVDGNYEIVTHDGVLTVAAHKVKVVWTYTEYIYTKTEQKVYVMLEDENGNRTPCGATVTDMDGNPVAFRDIGKYVATAVLTDGYVLDPEYADTVTANLKIVKNGAFEFDPLILLIILMIVIIAAYMIYEHWHRKA
ncbi:MAG: hypothetical protein II855_00580, partial [Candidatus Methanomethylophilaceae archaeon]|nr:hypothetical protein [Candidatus Methanomethylophilaceae archaeon]